METFNDIKSLWQSASAPADTRLELSAATFDTVIRPRIRKEKKEMAAYFWTSFVYQNLVYAFACYLLLRHWHDAEMVMLCLSGIILYIPFTVLLMQKFKAMLLMKITSKDIHTNIRRQQLLLAGFFRSKRLFDVVMIPVTGFILTGIIFKLYVPGGPGANLTGAIFVYIGWLIIFSMAAISENRKHFIIPLRRFAALLQDIEKGDLTDNVAH